MPWPCQELKETTVAVATHDVADGAGCSILEALLPLPRPIRRCIDLYNIVIVIFVVAVVAMMYTSYEDGKDDVCVVVT